MTHTLAQLFGNIELWHHERNLIEGSTDKDQFLKLIQECGELSDNICKNKDVADDIGDIMVVLINIAVRNGLSIEHCLEVAYNDIKDRKGTMVDGVFIKEDNIINTVEQEQLEAEDMRMNYNVEVMTPIKRRTLENTLNLSRNKRKL